MKTFKIYNSVADLAATLATKKPFSCWDNPVSARNEKSHSSWAGASMTESYKLLSTGDAEGAKKIKAQGEILTEKENGKVPEVVSSVVGCVPCVPDYLMGVPKNMLKVVREPKHMPIIDIYVDGAVWDGCDVDRAAMAAAKIANVITATEMAGVRVNLYAMVASSKGSDCACMIVKLKDDDAPLNLLNVAFPLTHRAFCRSIYLDWLEKHHNKKMSNYGSVLSANRIKSEFNLQGLVLSTSDMMEQDTTIEELAEKVNKYIKERESDF